MMGLPFHLAVLFVVKDADVFAGPSSLIHSLAVCLLRVFVVTAPILGLAVQSGVEMKPQVSQSSHSSEGFQRGSWRQVFFCFGKSWDLSDTTQTSCLLLTNFNQHLGKQNLVQQFWNAGLQMNVGLSLQHSHLRCLLKMPFRSLALRFLLIHSQSLIQKI